MPNYFVRVDAIYVEHAFGEPRNNFVDVYYFQEKLDKMFNYFQGLHIL